MCTSHFTLQLDIHGLMQERRYSIQLLTHRCYVFLVLIHRYLFLALHLCDNCKGEWKTKFYKVVPVDRIDIFHSVVKDALLRAIYVQDVCTRRHSTSHVKLGISTWNEPSHDIHRHDLRWHYTICFIYIQLHVCIIVILICSSLMWRWLTLSYDLRYLQHHNSSGQSFTLKSIRLFKKIHARYREEYHESNKYKLVKTKWFWNCVVFLDILVQAFIKIIHGNAGNKSISRWQVSGLLSPVFSQQYY